MESKINTDAIKATKEEIISLIGSEDKTTLNEKLDLLVNLVQEKKEEPVEFILPLKDVVDRIDGGSYELIKARGMYIYRVKGGMRLIASERMKSLYGALDFAFNFLKGRTKYVSDDDVYSLSNTAIFSILNLPIYIFSDPEFMLKLATDITIRLSDNYQKSVDAELKEDDNPELTEAFVNAMSASENLAKNVKDSKNGEK